MIKEFISKIAAALQPFGEGDYVDYGNGLWIIEKVIAPPNATKWFLDPNWDTAQLRLVNVKTNEIAYAVGASVKRLTPVEIAQYRMALSKGEIDEDEYAIPELQKSD